MTLAGTAGVSPTMWIERCSVVALARLPLVANSVGRRSLQSTLYEFTPTGDPDIPIRVNTHASCRPR